MGLLISSGALGRLGMIHSFNYTNFLYRPRRPEELDTARGGGILFNQVPHQIDTARLFGGGLVKSVRAQTTVLDPTRPTEGSCAALLQFENGAAASLVYSGYDYFDSDQWHFGISERGARKKSITEPRGERCSRPPMKPAPEPKLSPTVRANGDTPSSATFRHHYCDLRTGRTASHRPTV